MPPHIPSSKFPLKVKHVYLFTYYRRQEINKYLLFGQETLSGSILSQNTIKGGVKIFGGHRQGNSLEERGLEPEVEVCQSPEGQELRTQKTGRVNF